MTVLAAVLGIVVLLCFRETRSFPRATMLPTGKICSCLVGLRLSAQLKSRAKMRFVVSFDVKSNISVVMEAINIHDGTAQRSI